MTTSGANAARQDSTATVDSLHKSIGRNGDALWKTRVSENWNGEYVPEQENHAAPTIVLSKWLQNFEPKAGPHLMVLATVGVLFLLPVEFLLLLARFGLYLVVWMIWRAEQAWARMVGISFFCPLCHHVTCDPFCFCPRCGRVQGALRPSLGGLLRQSCAGCGETTWPTLGNYLKRMPKHLVCRHVRDEKGCYRPIQLYDLGRPIAAQHVALLSPSASLKFAVLVQLIELALEGRGRRASYRIPWELNRQEVKFLSQRLRSAPEAYAQASETPGQIYTLARTFILHRQTARSCVLHNVVQAWLASAETLFSKGLAWKHVRCVIFVVDLDLAVGESTLGQLTHAEAFSRLLRAIEHDVPLDPHSPPRVKFAVVVPRRGARAGRSVAATVVMDPEAVLCANVPSLYALLRASIPRRQLRFYSGSLPETESGERAAWLESLLNWMT